MNVAPDYQTPRRMALKRRAVPLPDVMGKSVLDIGCDMGEWSFLMHDMGAQYVAGIDRNRSVNGIGPYNLVDHCNRRAVHEGRAGCQFRKMELGKQWHEHGKFDVALCLSMYHHAYEAAGGIHEPLWFWLRRQLKTDGVLLWEGPVDTSDPVVRANVSEHHHRRYARDAILASAGHWFDAEYVGPALHEPTREVWRFTARAGVENYSPVTAVSGSGGATKAFEYLYGRRIGEIEYALGIRPVPGSLNIRIVNAFDWHRGYYRSQVLDVAERGKGLDVEWKPRWARFYPVQLNGVDAFAFRFEGERYPSDFMELIASQRLRDVVTGPLTLQW